MLINTEHLIEAFKILLFGWAGIFLVLFILYGVSLLLLKAFPVKEDEEIRK